MGERGDLLLFAPKPTSVLPPELQGRVILKTKYRNPPVVLLYAQDDYPQSVTVAALALTKQPQKFLAETHPAAPSTRFPTTDDDYTAMAVTHTLPKAVYDRIQENQEISGASNISLPPSLVSFGDRLVKRPFSYLAFEPGLWRLERGGLFLAGSKPICQRLPNGETFSWANDNLLRVEFPRKWPFKPIIMVGLMSPMLSAPLAGIVGVLRIESITTTDFVVRLPPNLCDAIASSRPLVGHESTFQALVELDEEKAQPWGDDPDEYLTGEIVHFDSAQKTPPTNPFAYEYHDWSGFPASQRPCSDSGQSEVESVPAIDESIVDTGYGPNQTKIEADNAYPELQRRPSASVATAPLQVRPPGLGKISLSFIAISEGVDAFEGGVNVHATKISVPVTPDLFPVDMDVGVGNDPIRQPTIPHPEALDSDPAAWDDGSAEMQQNPLTGAWEFVGRPKSERDYSSSLLMSSIQDKTHAQTVALVFRPSQELEMMITDAVNDTMEFNARSWHSFAQSLNLLQSAADLDVEISQVITSTTPIPTPALAPFGESSRVVVAAPVTSRGDIVRVAFDNSYIKPVFIAQPLTKSSLVNEPMVTMVREVTSTSASIMLVKPSAYSSASGSRTSIITERVSFVVMENGVFKVGDSLVQASTVNTDLMSPHTGWLRVNFSVPFTRKPVVLAQLQTYNVPSTNSSNGQYLPYLKTRVVQVDFTGFSVALETESETFTQTLTNTPLSGQVIGFVAVDAGSKTIDTWGTVRVQSDWTGVSIFDSWQLINFAKDVAVTSASASQASSSNLFDANGNAVRDVSTAPVFLAQVSTYENDDPCHNRIRNLNGDSVEIKVESDDLASPRTATDKEALSYLVFSMTGIFKASRFTDGTFVSAGPSSYSVAGAALIKSFEKLPPAFIPIGCANNCSNHGICNTTTGICACDQFYDGPKCDKPKRTFVGENGKIQVSLNFKQELYTIPFRQAYRQPVVFLSPLTRSSGDIPIVPRIFNVSSRSCSVFIEQPHRWQGGATYQQPTETLMYFVMESGVWQIDDEGNTIEIQLMRTSAAAGFESVPVAFKRKRGPAALQGRQTRPVVFTQVQTVNNRLMTRSVVTKVDSTAFVSVALETERVVNPSDSKGRAIDVSNSSIQNLRFSTFGPVNGQLSGTLYFDPPKNATSASFLDVFFATSQSLNSTIGEPFASLTVSNSSSSYTFNNIAKPSSALYILVSSKPASGVPAYAPILALDDNPYYPSSIPTNVDPYNMPILVETVGVMILSAGVGTWDNKSYIANTRAPLPQPSILQWVDFLDPTSFRPHPLVTFESAPSTYLALLDPELTQLGVIPAHLSLGTSYAQSIDRSSARLKLDVEIKADRAKSLPSNMTVSYFALIQEGLLSAKKAGCPGDCSNNGQCVDDVCICGPFFGGDDCSLFANPGACVPACTSVNARCLNGQCTCVNGFTGPDCSQLVSNTIPVPNIEKFCPRNCSFHGDCNGNACSCSPGWAGDDCSQPVCINGCNEPNGACVSGKCVCAETYTGDRCTARTCFPHPTCANNGKCQDGVCLCNDGWKGDDCRTELPTLVCPNSCSGHGACNRGVCTCFDGFTGPDCSQRMTCPIGVFMGVKEECTGHGWCDKGKCKCSSGWIGLDCSTIDVTFPSDCPFNCSGRGLCTPIGCVCDEPFGGRGCRQMSNSLLEVGEVISVVLKITSEAPVQTVQFARRYRNPVVFAKPPSRSNPEPFAVQILAVGSDHCNVSSVQAQLEFLRRIHHNPSLRLKSVSLSAQSTGSVANVEPAFQDVPDIQELVTFFIIEEGSWDLHNGMLLHAGRIPVPRISEVYGSYKQGFSRFFTEVPAVITQTQLSLATTLVRARLRSVKAKGFVLGADVLNITDVNGEFDDPFADSSLGEVTVGWVAVGPSSSSVITDLSPSSIFEFGHRPFYSGVKFVQLRSEWHHFDFPLTANLLEPHVIADVAQASAFNLRFHALKSTSVSLGLEDESGRLALEPSHSALLSVLVFGSVGPLHATAVSCPDRCGYDGERGFCDRSKCSCEKGWAGLTCKVPEANCPNQCSGRGVW
jgi:hypothetical protein